METPAHYVLIVANRTAATPRLLDHVRKCALRGPCEFTLLVPALADTAAAQAEAREIVELALPLLGQAAGRPVKGIVGPSDPLLAVEHALAREHFDEVTVATLPERASRWLARDLPARIERPWVPVAVVTAKSTAADDGDGAA